YERAFPVLARHGFSATIFVVADYCGRDNSWPSQPAGIPRRPLSTWQQVRELDRFGIEIGAHTLSHPRLDRIAPDQMEAEVVGSKARIEQQVGHQVDLFAYPYGRYDSAARALVGRTYVGACGTRPGLVNPGSDPFILDRIEARYLAQRLALRILPSAVLGPYLELRRLLRSGA